MGHTTTETIVLDTVIARGDSHTCTHGALGALGTGLGVAAAGGFVEWSRAHPPVRIA
jgi:homoaconitase/3-isopropylmalate dehydratase large subunit